MAGQRVRSRGGDGYRDRGGSARRISLEAPASLRSLAAAALLWCAACDVALVRGVPRAEAAALIRELDRHGIVARMVSEPGDTHRARVDVDEGAFADAAAIVLRGRRAAGGRGPAAFGCSAPCDESTTTPAPIVETRSQERARRSTALARELEATLAHLPGVRAARVHLSLPAGSALLPELDPPPSAAALLETARGHSNVAAAQQLISGAVPGLSPERVRVVESAAVELASAPPQWSRIGPIVVTRASASTLKRWLAGSLLLHMLLAAALLRPLLRKRRDRGPQTPA